MNLKQRMGIGIIVVGCVLALGMFTQLGSPYMWAFGIIGGCVIIVGAMLLDDGNCQDYCQD